MYIHRNLPLTVVTLNSTLEAVAGKVKFNNTYLTICSIYCPPGIMVNYDELLALEDSLPSPKLILGDYNAHHILWGSQRVDVRGEQIAKLLNETDLVILNDGSPTRVSDSTGELSI